MSASINSRPAQLRFEGFEAFRVLRLREGEKEEREEGLNDLDF
jgi:hypothetical protein